MMNVTLKQLEVLSAVVVAGSISKASRSLNLSQPSISQQIAKLEDSLGTRLLNRGGSQMTRLTPAGEFWYKSATELLGSFDQTIKSHKTMFGKTDLTLTFATMTSLQKQFCRPAAQTALAIGQFNRFETVDAKTSSGVIELINIHRANCGIITTHNQAGVHGSFHAEHLYTDRMAWITPGDVPDHALFQALKFGTASDQASGPLSKIIEVPAPPPMAEVCEHWCRRTLPFARSAINCSTYDAAVDLVAAGIGTCLVPVSQLATLPHRQQQKLKIVELDILDQEAVFVMPRHLRNIKAFAEFCRLVCDDIRANHLARSNELKSFTNDTTPHLHLHAQAS